MPKPAKKKRQGRKRVIETALPKKQYKRINRLFYVFSGILLVVFGGGAALLGAGARPGPQAAPTPVVSTVTGSPADQTPATTPGPAVAGTATVPTPAAGTATTPAPAAGSTATPAAAAGAAATTPVSPAAPTTAPSTVTAPTPAPPTPTAKP